MKKYQNISNMTLALDCITKTVFMQPGEILQLPRSRDVRYYTGLRKLKLIRVKEEQITVPEMESEKMSNLAEDAKPTKPAKGKMAKGFNKQEETDQNNNKDMEIK